MPRIGRGSKRSTVTNEQILAMLDEGYLPNDIAAHLKVWAQRVRAIQRSSRFRLSQLNIDTTAKWQACQDRGGCVPSGQYVNRSFPQGDLDLSVCKRCGVPIWPRELRALHASRQRAIDIQRGRAA